MNTNAILIGAALAALASGPVLATPTVEIKDAAVRIVVLPENRNDIAVEVYGANPALPLTVTQFGGDVIIDGHLPNFLTSCHGEGDGLHALVFGKGDFSVSEFPRVLVRTPMSVNVSSGGIVRGSVSRSENLSIHHGGCGDWEVGNVAGSLEADVSGIGSVHTGVAHSADLSLSGSGKLTSVAVDGQLTARISGSGLISVQRSGAADITITGTGSIKTGPVAGALTADISGAGGLEVASVDGPVTADVSGVGDVSIPQGHATSLRARVSGSGNVRFGGVADSLDADVSGVGNVDVTKVTGAVDQRVSGIGSVHVGGK